MMPPKDVSKMIDFERDVRVERADTEAFHVELRAPGCFAITGSSGGTYVVDLLDGSDPDSEAVCSCPDFIFGRLGVCKHVLAVRRALMLPKRKRRGLDTKEEEDSEARRGGTTSIVLPRVLENGEIALSVGGRDSLNNREISTTELEALLRDGTARVTESAIAAARVIDRRAAQTERRKVVGDAIASGELSVDVLAEPLFDYQREGVAHLLRAGRAVLADDMGLGKTVQTIAACEVLRRARGEARRILIVCPASLKAQWASEIARYAPGAKVVVVGGDAPERREALAAADAAYVIVNYELTWRELGALKSLETDVLVLDEAQRAKNFRTKTAATLKSIPSPFVFVLSGTPVENRLDDLYGILQLIDPSILGPLWKFNLDYQERDAETGRVVRYTNLAQLRKVIEPHVLRRKKETVLDQLPELTEQTRYVPLTKEQAALEAKHRGAARALAAVARTRALTAEERTRLVGHLQSARMACDAEPDGRAWRVSPKIDELAQLVMDIAQQQEDDPPPSKVLIFSEWTEMLRLVERKLSSLGIGSTTLHGGVLSSKRPALIEEFRSDPKKVALLSTDAGGVGLNLQVASYVIHLDLPWNPARLDQRTARAHRVGQQRGVSVTYLVAERGIEREIESTLAAKRGLRSAALDQHAKADELGVSSLTEFLDAEEEAPSAGKKPREPDAEAKARQRLRLAQVVAASYREDAITALQEALEALGDEVPRSLIESLTAPDLDIAKAIDATSRLIEGR